MAPTPLYDWNDLAARLKAYRKKNGHANVPTICPKDEQLGRWLAMQRHKHKTGKLTQERVQMLDALGVVWAPSDVSWEHLYNTLIAYKKKHGSCAVPTKWPQNVKLADWVQRQRILRKKGKLVASRVAKLDAIDFFWEIYKGCKLEKPDIRARHQSKPKTKPNPNPHLQPQEEAELSNERLYRLGSNTFVQFDGKSDPPPLIQKYIERNRGDSPAYIPLPNRAVTFTIGEAWGKVTRLSWKGQGKLPAKVLEFVQEHGTLPPHL